MNRSLILGAAAVACAGLGVPVRIFGQSGGQIADVMSGDDTIPDRVSIEPDSPFFFADYAKLGVRINGKDSNQVVEFCQSEGWVRLCMRDGHGRMRRERGRPVTSTFDGTIEPYWRAEASPDAAVVVLPQASGKTDGGKPAISREQARRQRQEAARLAKAQRA